MPVVLVPNAANAAKALAESTAKLRFIGEFHHDDGGLIF
jgi:hypothetical protein